MWEIYSIGDSAYLAAILNAVAMISGTGDFRQLAGVGFLLGVLLVLFQGILQGGRGIRFQNVLVAWLLYALMFGPTARVAIEDAYPGAVRVVDNVPLGPAAVGSLMSNVGYGVSRLFEQAFATPAMTDTGFADPLQTLMSVRKGTLSRIALGSANSPTPGADIERSFINYVADCTLYDVDIGGTRTGSYATNEQLQDQIADDIARRVTSDRDFSARLAEGVKADMQSGARNVFAERLTQEERSTLQEQASDTLTAARSLERSESLAERFGTLGSYRAVEIGHAVAKDPALMDRMYDRLDRLGLTGDHQRLASSWSYSDVFADRDQANAAAGMALLLGYGEGDRALTTQEQQMAREGGFGILSDAFGGPRPHGIAPGRNADLDGRASGYGAEGAEVGRGSLSDPR